MDNKIVEKFEKYCDLLDECCPVVLLNALALLKESVSQEYVAQIRWERDIAESQLDEIGKGFGEKMDDVAKIVRCKDCKHWEQYSDVPNIGNCPVLDQSRRTNWFCADGESKE